MRDLVRKFSKPDDSVLDAFSGTFSAREASYWVDEH